MNLVLVLLSMAFSSCNTLQANKSDKSSESYFENGSCTFEASEQIVELCKDHTNYQSVKGKYDLEMMCQSKGGKFAKEFCKVPKGKIGCTSSYGKTLETYWYIGDSQYEDGKPSCPKGSKEIVKSS